MINIDVKNKKGTGDKNPQQLIPAYSTYPESN